MFANVTDGRFLLNPMITLFGVVITESSVIDIYYGVGNSSITGCTIQYLISNTQEGLLCRQINQSSVDAFSKDLTHYMWSPSRVCCNLQSLSQILTTVVVYKAINKESDHHLRMCNFCFIIPLFCSVGGKDYLKTKIVKHFYFFNILHLRSWNVYGRLKGKQSMFSQQNIIF